MGILPVLVLLAGKMPAPQKILGYFFNCKSLINFYRKIVLPYQNSSYQILRRMSTTFIDKMRIFSAYGCKKYRQISFTLKVLPIL